MSKHGMTVTVLATQLAEAVAADERPDAGGFDLSAGMFGEAVSAWLRQTAAALNSDPLTPYEQELLTRLEDAKRLLHEFCERVERGEVRSVKTYAKFKAFLDQPSPKHPGEEQAP